jgi:hypothetical protein
MSAGAFSQLISRAVARAGGDVSVSCPVSLASSSDDRACSNSRRFAAAGTEVADVTDITDGGRELIHLSGFPLLSSSSGGSRVGVIVDLLLEALETGTCPLVTILPAHFTSSATLGSLYCMWRWRGLYKEPNPVDGALRVPRDENFVMGVFRVTPRVENSVTGIFESLSSVSCSCARTILSLA